MRTAAAIYLPPLLLGVSLRVWSLFLFVDGSPFAHHLFSDAHRYLQWAKWIAAGDAPGGAFYQAPLYPFFLSILVRLFGENLTAFYIVQLFLGSLSILLVTALALRFLPRVCALASACVYALLPYPVFFETRLFPETFALPVALLALLLILRSEGSKGRSVLAGVATGFAALARSNLLLFALLLTVMNLKSRWKSAVFFFAAFLAVVLPVTLRNYSAGDGWVPISSNAGEVFYHGNNENAAGSMGRIPGLKPDIGTMGSESKRLASIESGRELHAAGASAFWFGKGMRWISAHPADYLKLELRKARLLISGRFTPLSSFFDFESERYPGVPAALLYLHYPVLLFALIGLFRRETRRVVPRVLLLFGLVQVVTVLFFFVSTRYLIPLAPVFVLLGGAGLAYAPKRGWMIAAAAVPVLLLLVTDEMWEKPRAMPYAQLASIFSSEWKVTESVALYEEALRISPMELVHYQNLAKEKVKAGYSEEGTKVIERAMELGLVDGVTLGYYGGLLYEQDRLEESERYLRESIRIAPGIAHTHYVLGRLMVKLRRYETAVVSYIRAAELDPDDIHPHRDLYRLYTGPLNNPERAEEEKQVLLKLYGRK